MNKTAQPERFQLDSAKRCATQLKDAAFQGDADEFAAVWSRYLRNNPWDPIGRHALDEATRPSMSLLSYQSVGPFNRERGAEESMLRRRMWMEVMPLDMQLNLFIWEYTPYDPCNELFDFSDFKWDQMGSVPGFKGRDHRLLVRRTQVLGQFLSSKLWNQASLWMEKSGLDPWEEMFVFWAHHEKTGSRGSSMVSSEPPLPLWALGLFTGASEPEFWQVMEKAGGPASPAQALSECPGKGIRAPDLEDPMQGVEENGRLLSDAMPRITETASLWRRAALAEQSPQSRVTIRPSRL